MKTSSLLFLGLLLTCAGSVCAAAEDTHEDNRPATTQQMKDQERVDIEKRTNALPSAGPFKIEQVVHLAIQDGRVIATTTVGPSDGERHVLLDNDNSLATLLIQPMGDRTLRRPLSSLQFLRYDFSDPSIVFLHTAVLTHPGYVQLVGDAELGAGTRQITLLDQGPTVGEAGERVEGGISLRVQIDSGQGDRSVDLVLKAPDLPALMRLYPSEINTYLRPILREFHAESILAVDPLVAWQIFSSEMTPDPAVVSRIPGLLKELDAPAFTQRSAAAESLKKLGAPGAIALMKLDRNALSPEQNSRLDDILSAFQQLAPKDADAIANQTGFLLDCMASDDAEIRRIGLARLTKKVGHEIAFDPSGSVETRQAALDSLRQKLLPAPATHVAERE